MLLYCKKILKITAANEDDVVKSAFLEGIHEGYDSENQNYKNKKIL